MQLHNDSSHNKVVFRKNVYIKTRSCHVLLANFAAKATVSNVSFYKAPFYIPYTTAIHTLQQNKPTDSFKWGHPFQHSGFKVCLKTVLRCTYKTTYVASSRRNQHILWNNCTFLNIPILRCKPPDGSTLFIYFNQHDLNADFCKKSSQENWKLMCVMESVAANASISRNKAC